MEWSNDKLDKISCRYNSAVAVSTLPQYPTTQPTQQSVNTNTTLSFSLRRKVEPWRHHQHHHHHPHHQFCTNKASASASLQSEVKSSQSQFPILIFHHEKRTKKQAPAGQTKPDQVRFEFDDELFCFCFCANSISLIL